MFTFTLTCLFCTQCPNYYVCSCIDERDLANSKTFKLTKSEMESEVAKMGSITHGTKEAVSDNKNKEYSITLDVLNENNENTQRWMSRYWFAGLYDQLNGG